MVSPDNPSVKPDPALRQSAGVAQLYVVLGLGSNLGDRNEHLAGARRGLFGNGFPWTLASSIWETVAEGGPPGQQPYLNQVLAAPAGSVSLDPFELLSLCRAVEDRAARRRVVRWGPRTLDVDILIYGSRVIDSPELSIPHPWLARRSFAIGPIAETLPLLVEPVTGLTAVELWSRIASEGRSCRSRGGPRTMPSARP